MLVRLLGTGNAPQIPVFGCACGVCQRARTDTQYRRRPASAEIQTSEGRFLLDAGRCDLADWVDPGTLRGVILTHYHMDHVAGLFHLRWGTVAPRIPVYGPDDPAGADDLLTHPGCLDFSHTLSPYQTVQVTPELSITPIPVKHSRMTYGYIIRGNRESMVYLSDCDGIGPESIATIRDASPSAVIVDCTFPPAMGRNHLSLDRALELLPILNVPRMYLTHIGHQLEAYLLEHPLPTDGEVVLTRDGMTFTID